MLLSMNMKAESLKINYKRINSDYEGWKLWIWDKSEGKVGFELLPEGKNDFGLVFKLDLDKYGLMNKEIGILPKYGNWESKEAFDRILRYSGEKEIYIVEADEKIYNNINDMNISTETTKAFYDTGGNIRVVFNRTVYTKSISDEFYLINKKSGEKKKIFKVDNNGISNTVYFKTEPLDINEIKDNDYIVSSKYGETLVRFGNVLYTFSPYNDMGEITGDDGITFRIFSTAKEINLLIQRDNKEEKIPFKYDKDFVWEVKLSTSYYGSTYRYEAVYPDKTLYGIDPSAKCSIRNNTYAMIVNDNSNVIPSPKFNNSELVIYEMSIRDLTSDSLSGVKNKGKYLGLTEEETTHPDFSDIRTGISHLKELGINAVHIMPFYDFENDENSSSYDWGYMPVSFNSPDGSFAVDKMAGKIKETKAMISEFHKNGIKVIMDVVYNHTAETSENKVYNFNLLAHDYYYRTNLDGKYSNGSGCGNEFKTESPYGRKFIIDSLKYWITSYKIDGFRFDLMGLMDQDTVIEILNEIRKIKPDIIIYGEPWTGGVTPIKGVYKGFQKGKNFAVFNDDFRDAIKGSVFDIKNLGYVQNQSNRETVIKGIKGSIDLFTDSPLETINYVSCHDNHTLFDRLKLSMPDDDLKTIIKRDKLAEAIILTSQGIPFILSGEEILRTKNGNDNSYNAGDEINKIDWTRKKVFYDVFKYYRDLIDMRKNHPAFRMETKNDILKNIKFYEELGIKLPDDKSIAYIIDGSNAGDSWNQITVLINPNTDSRTFNLMDGKWQLKFDENGYSERKIFRGTIILPPLSLYVLSK